MAQKKKQRSGAGSVPLLLRWVRSDRAWIGLVVGLILVLFVLERFWTEEQLGGLRQPSEALFVGDAMLARYVETLMDQRGTSYPFRGVRDLFSEYEVVVGNFEAAMPERHIPTPSGAMRFSVEETSAPVLARVGFTHLSLANNHTYDYGREGYEHTREVLTGAGLTAFGHPYRFSASEVSSFVLDGITVALIPLSGVTVGAPSDEELEEVLTAAGGDFQIVYVHWGDEYRSSATEAQRALAHRLIDQGADAVIGHHPHVVAEVEEYRGAVIFYSLGNFIFDQYWEPRVQQGLAVALSFRDDEAHLTLIPTTSIDEPSAPRPMNRIERGQFLAELAALSEPSLRESIREGVVAVPFFDADREAHLHSQQSSL